MSEKRYELKYSNHDGSGVVLDGGERLDSHEVLARLNTQAEKIEVFREWIRNTPINDDFDSIDDFERKLIRIQGEGGCGGMEERVELAKRRIAALEGE